MIKCGDKVKDKYSDVTGIVMCRTEYLYGCVRLGINTGHIHDGTPIDWLYYDEPQLILIESIKEGTPDSDKHGPQSDPPNRNQPN